jgi:hypothetical protein
MPTPSPVLRLARAAVLALVGVLPLASAAQTPEAEREAGPLAPLDMSSPRATFDSFLLQAGAFKQTYLGYRADKTMQV